jgi:hypothetical protein
MTLSDYGFGFNAAMRRRRNTPTDGERSRDELFPILIKAWVVCVHTRQLL